MYGKSSVDRVLVWFAGECTVYVDRKVQAACSSALRALAKAEVFPAVRASTGLKVRYGGTAVFGAKLEGPADAPVLCPVRFRDATMAECWLSSGPPAWAGASWACMACRWAVALGCGKGAEGAQCPRSGLTTKYVQSPQIGLVSCLSHLHAQLIVPNASQNMQM